jgi:hypothetical protein
LSREIHIHRLTHETVHEISRTFDIPVETLMQMLANAVYHNLEYQFVSPDENWIPGTWWRVSDPFGTVIYSDVHEDKARSLLMDGYILERNYVSPSKTKWQKEN